MNGVGVQADISRRRLPSDAYPALFAYSLNRKLRYLYDGPYFRYRQQSGGEYEYPNRTPDLTEEVYLVKIYDQKIRFGVPVQDAVQLDQSKQPKLEKSVTYKAVFNEKEYFDVLNLAPHIGHNFTITVIGEGDNIPRPLIGIWGESDKVTYEPSTLTNRFSFNSNLGSIISSTEETSQCFSGYEETQNYTNVMSVRIGDQVAYRARTEINPAFTNISIGRESQRLYKGSFREVIMHLGNLTKLGAKQLYTTTRTHYGY